MIKNHDFQRYFECEAHLLGQLCTEDSAKVVWQRIGANQGRLQKVLCDSKVDDLQFRLAVERVMKMTCEHFGTAIRVPQMIDTKWMLTQDEILRMQSKFYTILSRCGDAKRIGELWKRYYEALQSAVIANARGDTTNLGRHMKHAKLFARELGYYLDLTVQ